MGDGLSHLDPEGRVRMVDVGSKEVTRREAEAVATVRMSAEAFDKLRDGSLPKGDVPSTVRLAAIQAAKRTSTLIPLCHQVPLDAVEVSLEFDQEAPQVTVRAVARARGVTGVEMEALTAAAVGALTLYDMCKAVDRGMVIEGIALLRKSGGRSGDYRRG
jgi:cyclic pyranopterin monophosphate synthase